MSATPDNASLITRPIHDPAPGAVSSTRSRSGEDMIDSAAFLVRSSAVDQRWA